MFAKEMSLKFLVLFIAFLSFSEAYGASLKVVVEGIKEIKGEIRIAVYANEDDWLDVKKAVVTTQKKLSEKSFKITYKGLGKGEYGVAVFQDLNQDGKLNFQFFPPGPGEPVGFSNMKEMGFGRPSFDDAKFDLEGDMTMVVKLIEL